MPDPVPAHERTPRPAPSTDAADADNRDRILAGLLHELKTPLSAIVLWTSFLDDHREELSPVVRQALDSIKRSAREEQKLIEDLGVSVRITTGKLLLDREALDLVPLLREAVKSAREGVADRALVFEEQLDATNARISADPVWIRQMIERLVSHAIRRSPPAGKIIVSVAADDSSVRLTISDNGKDLPPNYLTQDFENVSGGSGPARPETRLALPLAIVRQIVDLHGGAVAASGVAHGSGAAFSVSLPRLEVERTGCVANTIPKA